MANVITNLQPTTELEAVNVMLASIGEAPLDPSTDLNTATQADVSMAINILRNVCRDIQAMGWRFNTEFGVELAPTTTYSWLDSKGTTTVLNIFKKPSNILKWSQTRCWQNNGIDLVERPSKAYQETGAAVLVLYDRYQNRDGPAAAQYPFVYLDITTAFDFVQCPESARLLMTMQAARRFVQQSVGSPDLRAFTEEDEKVAARDLVRDQGLREKYNLFNTGEAQSQLGFRQRPYGGISRWVYPGKG